MGAGVLGTKPSDVEAALDHALELCRLWNAMLLLDEADIFLGARTDDGLARNELVSSAFSCFSLLFSSSSLLFSFQIPTDTAQSSSPNSSTTKASSS